jgi:hypothetical protein
MTCRTLVGLIVLLTAAGAGAQTPAPARPVSADCVAPGPVVPLDATAMAAIGGLRSQALASAWVFAER